MHPHHPQAIPLYPNPPYTRDELLSDVPSNFPPIKIHKSSPSPCAFHKSVLPPLLDGPGTATVFYQQVSTTVVAPFSTVIWGAWTQECSQHGWSDCARCQGKESNLAGSHSNYMFVRMFPNPRRSEAENILISTVTTLRKNIVSLPLIHMMWSGWRATLATWRGRSMTWKMRLGTWRRV